jgi:hypothetical protein
MLAAANTSKFWLSEADIRTKGGEAYRLRRFAFALNNRLRFDQNCERAGTVRTAGRAKRHCNMNSRFRKEAAQDTWQIWRFEVNACNL